MSEVDAEEAIRAKERQATGDWRILHYERLRVLFSEPNIMRAIKSRRDGRGM